MLACTLALAATACASGAPAPRPEPPFALRIETSGGFAGRGRGGLTLEAGGRLVAQPPLGRGPAPGAPPCESALTAAEARRVEEAVAAARPEGWAARKLGPPAPDAFAYALSLFRDGAEHRVVWHDNTAGRRPPDVVELFASVERVWERALGACTPVR